MSLRFDRVMDEREAGQLNALQLAYMGDTVWELIVRHGLVWRKMNVKHMHGKCVSLVNAGAQHLHPREIVLVDHVEVIRPHVVKAGFRKAGGNVIDAMATGFEALLGYLYLTGQNERIREMIQQIQEVNEDG